MNTQDAEILNILSKKTYENQRSVAKECTYSLGSVNKTIKRLSENGYIDFQMKPTKKAEEMIRKNSPKNAVILAAGFGMRMIPLNLQYTKGLLEIQGETLIERLIRQLHEVGVYNICVVVGFMMEAYEFLIDKYNVKLIPNDNYMLSNNLYSLALVTKYIDNTYIIPCDIWCKENPFRQKEITSWYMISECESRESSVHLTRSNELIKKTKSAKSNRMIGIAYINHSDCERLNGKLLDMSKDKDYENAFWEEALFENDKFIIPARKIADKTVFEINTYEQLRELDCGSNNLKSDVIKLIADVLKVDASDIQNVELSKKGMTNRSFLFTCKGKKYMMRIPGEGSDKLVNRKEEAEVYNALNGKNISDNVLYINPVDCYKIAEFIENSRVCNVNDEADLKLCMAKLKELHNNNLKVNHTFDLFGKINYYETLWDGKKSVFRDYEQTKKKVFSLQPFIEKNIEKKVLSHIDAVPDNFLITENFEKKDVRLIDWEYAGMQDPHIDIAMFCIYSFYDKTQADKLIDIYFENNCTEKIRAKIYCYIAACGLLWSNWCEYKRNMGVEFGEYALRQYRYAKDFYKLATEKMLNLGEKGV